MTIGFWDAGIIAGWLVAWLLVAGLILSLLGSFLKKRKQRNEVYSQIRNAVKTQDEFDKIARLLKEDGGTK